MRCPRCSAETRDLGKGCGGVGSYVSTHQKLCVHPQPMHIRAHAGFSLGGAAPACKRCRPRWTDPSARLQVPPQKRAATTRGCNGDVQGPGDPPGPSPASLAACSARPRPPAPGPRAARPAPNPASRPGSRRSAPRPDQASPRPDPGPTLTSRGPDPAAAQQPGQQQPGGRGQRGRRAAQHRSGSRRRGRPEAGAAGRRAGRRAGL